VFRSSPAALPRSSRRRSAHAGWHIWQRLLRGSSCSAEHNSKSC